MSPLLEGKIVLSAKIKHKRSPRELVNEILHFVFCKVTGPVLERYWHNEELHEIHLEHEGITVKIAVGKDLVVIQITVPLSHANVAVSEIITGAVDKLINHIMEITQDIYGREP